MHLFPAATAYQINFDTFSYPNFVAAEKWKRGKLTYEHKTCPSLRDNTNFCVVHPKENDSDNQTYLDAEKS